MKDKPVIKYRKSTLVFCGERHKLTYKLTLLATFHGELAKRIRDASNTTGLHWSYWNTKGKEKLEIYQEEKFEDKIVKPKSRI